MARKAWRPEERRLIYKYFNGEKEVAADPLKLQKLMTTGYPKESTLESDHKLFGLLQTHLNTELNDENRRSIEASHQKSFDAFDRMIKFARTVFSAKELSEDGTTGLTDTEVMLLMGDFGEWMVEVKKNIVATPTTLEPTASESLAV